MAMAISAPPHLLLLSSSSALSLSSCRIHRTPTNRTSILKLPSPFPSSASASSSSSSSASSASAAAAAASSTVRCHTPEAPAHLDDSALRSSCPSVKPEIHPSLFASTIDLRVGLITHAKPVLDPEMSEKRGKPTNSRRYLQLTVDIGCETRTIVSECKYVMDVEDAVGKKVLVVANVSPTDILGIRSHGLVLIGFNYDPTPMPRSFKAILPGLGRLPPGSQVAEATIPD